MIDLANNLNCLGPPAGLVDFINKDTPNLLSNYPNDSAGELTLEAIENSLEITSGSLCITSGSTQAIEITSKIYNHKDVFILKPTFWEYAHFNRKLNKSIHEIDILNNPDNIYTSINNTLKNYNKGTIYLCNPNNPTGQLINKSEIVKLIEDYPSINFVIDETYLWFNEHYKSISLFKEAPKYNNCLVLMSASKIYAVPGIRLGLVSSSTNTISNIRNHITPFSVGNLQIHTLEHLVTNEYAYLKYSQKQNSDNVNRIYKTFNQLGIKYIPTSANFVFIEDKAMKIANNFEKVGVKVRNGIDFGVDYQEFLRIKLWNQDLDNIIINVLKK